MAILKGLATGIGSLPHENVGAALDLIFECAPNIPFWPQLPKRDAREGMVAQFSENLPCLKINQGGLYFDYQEKEIEEFYERIIAQDIDYFRISEDFSLGLHKFYQRLATQGLDEVKFIKCHVTGPFTFAASINDKNGAMLLHDPVYMQIITKGLAMKALWQIRLFRKFGKKIIVFLDEPYLGCFGSAYTPINREDVLKGLSEITSGIKSADVLVGLHCCGNTDWSILTDTGSLDIISFDAFDFQERFVLYAGNIKGFLERGGIICWGIVPTQMFSGIETADFLIRKINEGINALVNKGVSRDLLCENLLISPSCGLGTFTPAKAEKILRLLSETSRFMRNVSP
jgi:methionine synthase II (cobalamin-independent)